MAAAPAEKSLYQRSVLLSRSSVARSTMVAPIRLFPEMSYAHTETYEKEKS